MSEAINDFEENNIDTIVENLKQLEKRFKERDKQVERALEVNPKQYDCEMR